MILDVKENVDHEVAMVNAALEAHADHKGVEVVMPSLGNMEDMENMVKMLVLTFERCVQMDVHNLVIKTVVL